MKTKVMHCTCKHEFQDQTYGKGNRVHNPIKGKTTTDQRVRCTVCGNEKDLK